MMLLMTQNAVSAAADSTNYDLEHVARTLEAMRDSMNVISSGITNAVQNTDPNPWTWISLGIAILSLIAAAYGVWFSKKTAANVGRVAVDTQLKLFEDLIRHLYRNLVCTFALQAKIEERWLEEDKKVKKGGGVDVYPSEEHLLKLKTLPDDVHLEQYNRNPLYYEKMHELDLLLRNYNTEIEVIQHHFSIPDISREVLKDDLERTLLFKPLYLTERIINVMVCIGEKQLFDKKFHNKVVRYPVWIYIKMMRFLGIKRCMTDNYNVEAFRIILSEHYNKLYEGCEKNIKKVEEMQKVKWNNEIKKVYCDKIKLKNWDVNISNHIHELSERIDFLTEKSSLEKIFVSVFTLKNQYLLEKFKENVLVNNRKWENFENMQIRDHLVVRRFNAYLKDVISEDGKEFLEKGLLDGFIAALITDVLIEYPKIRLIEFPKNK